MKVLINALRIIVGTLFVLAGIVKLNDPIGYALLLQNYFGEAGLQWDFIHNRALIFAVLLILMEITFGVILMLGYVFQLARWILVITSAGLTAFTLYIAYANTVADCGYLTSTSLLTPQASFWKFLSIFIVSIILFIKSHLIEPMFKLMVNKWIIFVTFIGSLFIHYEVLTHLPFFDFSPFKKGTSLTKEIEAPADYDFSPWDFSVFQGDKNLTSKLLDQEKLILIVSYDLTHSDTEGWEKIKSFTQEAKKQGYVIKALTPTSPHQINQFKTDFRLKIDFAQIDKNQAQNMIRANPGVLVLNKGVIVQKKHWNNLHGIKLKEEKSSPQN